MARARTQSRHCNFIAARFQYAIGMSANLSFTPQPGESSSVVATGGVSSGLLIIGQDQVIANSPELARLFPVLQQVRPALTELPEAIQQIIREAQSTNMPVQRELPINARGTVADVSALSLSTGYISRVVLDRKSVV